MQRLANPQLHWETRDILDEEDNWIVPALQDGSLDTAETFGMHIAKQPRGGYDFYPLWDALGDESQGLQWERPYCIENGKRVKAVAYGIR